MGVELRPLGVKCNISCKYCYQHSQREHEKNRKGYDMNKMKEGLSNAGQPFTLFGGEPLLLDFDALEEIFAWGYEKYKRNSIQTNGILITQKHIELFRRYKVDVGISLDGPGELNDLRWCRDLNTTRENTKKVEEIILMLCQENLAPGLIVTLHKCNGIKEKLPRMHQWMRDLENMGVNSVRLHLLEVDNQEIKDGYVLSTEESIEALLSFIKLEKELKKIRFDLTREIKALLMGKDSDVSCVWRACDPFNTLAVEGIEGDGGRSKCSRVNKDGVEYLRTEKCKYMRYLSLYNTPYEEGGCKGCRFFLMCKGQCPGTAIDGDWRNRSEHCEILKYLFGYMEREIVLEGGTPLTLHPVRKRLEHNIIQAWKRSANPPIAALSWAKPGDMPVENKENHSILHHVWLDIKVKDKWEYRINKIITMLKMLNGKCAEKGNEMISLTQSMNMLLLGIGINLSTTSIPFVISERNSLDNFSRFASEDGYTEEIEWLIEILSWPLVTSLKNGIYEIKAPGLKLVILQQIKEE